MKIHVEMTDEEFQEFKQWKKDKGIYDSELNAIKEKIVYFYMKVLCALEPDKKKRSTIKIVNQDHAKELLNMAHDWFC